MEINSPIKTSTKFPVESFQIREDFSTPVFSVIRDMLNPETMGPPVYIIRNFCSPSTTEELRRRFYSIIEETSGGNRQYDFVPVEQIGSNQFMKTSEAYMDECEKTAGNVNNLIASVSDSEARKDFLFENTLRSLFAKEGVEFRPSQYNGRSANMFTARKWTNNEGLALLPHEDLSQLNMAKKDDYEIGTVNKVIACNLCIANENGGEFILWNYCPSEETKINLGVENNGYPYPLDLLKDAETITVKLNPGDLYFIHANFVHGVKEILGKSRITLGRFMGYSNEKTVLYWT